MKYYKRLTVLLFVLILSAGTYLLFWRATVRQVDLVFTTDGHGHILPSTAYWKDDNPEIGGVSALGSFLKSLQRPYLLSDSGDIYQGTPEGVLTKGSIVVELMNVLGYEALAVGNHDFDHGRENLKALAEESEFPFLGANIIDRASASLPDFLSESFTKEINDVKLGIAGVTTEGMKNLVFTEHIEGLEFLPAAEIISGEVEKLKKKGAQIIILLSHRGFEPDIKLAREVEGVDVILGGHSHRLKEKPEIINKTLVSQSGSNFTHAGHISLFYSSLEKTIISYSHTMVPLYRKKYHEFAPVENILAGQLSEVTDQMERVIGRSSKRMSRTLTGEAQKHGELAIGNFQADVMRELSNSDFAFHNTGAIRSDIPEGEITVRDIWQLSPFGNSIVTMNLSGKQIKEILEISAGHKYSKLQLSGLRMIYNSSLPEGNRVLNIFVMTEDGQEVLDPEETYKVAVNSFLAQGGDGYEIFKEGDDIQDTSLLLREAQIEYIKENSPISASRQERLVNVSIE